jgi:radical SAM protein with 4Fe4S-binding SPASM domain
MYKRVKAPLDAQIEVTSACPHACRHCYNYWRTDPQHPPYMLSEESGRDIVNQLAAAGVFSIVVTGGEPLLNLPTSLACIECGHSHGMRVAMNSNLVLLTDETAARLRRAGLDHVLVSICGPDASLHDHITQRPGSFDRLVAAIPKAQNAGIRISLNMVVSRLNVNAVQATAELAAQFGVSSFTATKACCPGNCHDFSEFRLTSDDLTGFLNDLGKIRQTAGIPVQTGEPVPLCSLAGVECPELFTSKCYAGIVTMVVGADGSVRPCPHLDMEYGNILSQPVAEIWAAMDAWRTGEQIPAVCRQCPSFPLCGGGCRMEGKTYSGKLDALDPYANPPAAARVASIVKARMESNVEAKAAAIIARGEHALLHSFNRFKLSGFRMRAEDFGGAIMLDNGRWVLVDHQEYAALQQLKHDVIYDVASTHTAWTAPNPEQLVRGLVTKHLAVFVEDSFHYEILSGPEPNPS